MIRNLFTNRRTLIRFTQTFGLAIVFTLVSQGLSAQVCTTDDFNDGVFSGWTVQNGSFNESGGLLGGTNQALATLDGGISNKVGVDVVNCTNVNYIACVLNYTSNGNCLFVKIQDNTSNGLFDRLFFYHGNNGSSGVSDGYFVDLAFEVPSTYFEVTDNGDGTVSAYVEATGETFTRTLTNTYTGTGIGIGIYGDTGNCLADNYYSCGRDLVTIPTMSEWGLILFGLLLATLVSLSFYGKSKMAVA